MAQTSSPLDVKGISLLSALGASVEPTCAAIRAGIAGFSEHADYIPLWRELDWEVEPDTLFVAAAPGVDPSLEGPDRLLQLALPALRTLLATTRLRRRDLASTALLIALPEPDEVVQRWNLEESFAPALLQRSGVGFHHVHVAQGGHAGMLAMLREASALLNGEKVSRCVLLGVDSYLSEARLSYLDEAYRLKSRRGRDGFIPGEAAAALLLEPAARSRAGDAPPKATLLGLGIGVEPQAMASERLSTGEGLSNAIQGALRALPPDEAVHWVLCNLNGESYRAFEWGLMLARAADRFGGLRRLVHPADCIGDVGAATGGVLIACAAHSFARGCAPADSALVWAASDSGARAAIQVNRPLQRS